MNLFQSIGGMVEIEMVCADITNTLVAISSEGILMENIRFPSALTVQAQIARTQVRKIRSICNKRGDKIRVRYAKGIYWGTKSLLHRPVMTLGILLLCILSLWLSEKVLFIQVSGNVRVPTGVILDQAANTGVYFGASTRALRSEKVKNNLLEQIPQLQWVGVNTAGCVATIQVKENVQENQSTVISGTFDICAAKDAYITYVHATKGTVNCKIGQSVNAGQTLISAHSQAGESLLYTGAAGEVYGDTVRQIECIVPLKMQKREDIIDQQTKFSLIIGKKQINLHNDSGICSGSCVKIIKEDHLSLPGGFLLPVVLRTEYITYYDTDDSILSEDNLSWVEDYCCDYTKRQMVAGRILSDNFTQNLTDDIYTLQGDFTCNEMIGIITDEEIFHGEDR